MVRHVHGDDSGASAVEFALVLPILVMLLFGIMYGASLFNTQQTITQAAREGSRFGATLPLEDFSTDPEVAANADWLAAVASRAQSVLANDAPLTLGGTTPTVCVILSNADEVLSNGASNCPADGELGLLEDSPPRVFVRASRPAILELGISRLGPIDLTATGISRFEGEFE